MSTNSNEKSHGFLAFLTAAAISILVAGIVIEATAHYAPDKLPFTLPQWAQLHH